MDGGGLDYKVEQFVERLFIAKKRQSLDLSTSILIPKALCLLLISDLQSPAILPGSRGIFLVLMSNIHTKRKV